MPYGIRNGSTRRGSTGNPERCSKCQEMRPVSDFKRSHGYLSSECRGCLSRRAREKYSSDSNYRLRLLVNGRRYDRKIKLQTMEAYGGVCACCNEDRLEFLSIDHVLGGGSQQRKMVAKESVGSFYLWLKKLGYPKEPPLRVLCMNCNTAIGFYGYCPHSSTFEGFILDLRQRVVTAEGAS